MTKADIAAHKRIDRWATEPGTHRIAATTHSGYLPVFGYVVSMSERPLGGPHLRCVARTGGRTFAAAVRRAFRMMANTKERTDR